MTRLARRVWTEIPTRATPVMPAQDLRKSGEGCLQREIAPSVGYFQIKFAYLVYLCGVCGVCGE